MSWFLKVVASDFCIFYLDPFMINFIFLACVVFFSSVERPWLVKNGSNLPQVFASSDSDNKQEGWTAISVSLKWGGESYVMCYSWFSVSLALLCLNQDNFGLFSQSWSNPKLMAQSEFTAIFCKLNFCWNKPDVVLSTNLCLWLLGIKMWPTHVSESLKWGVSMSFTHCDHSWSA